MWHFLSVKLRRPKTWPLCVAIWHWISFFLFPFTRSINGTQHQQKEEKNTLRDWRSGILMVPIKTLLKLTTQNILRRQLKKMTSLYSSSESRRMQNAECRTQTTHCQRRYFLSARASSGTGHFDLIMSNARNTTTRRRIPRIVSRHAEAFSVLFFGIIIYYSRRSAYC